MLTILLGLLLGIYSSPVDYPITLAGNFGEPRPHHFHGGLDIKTDGVEGKKVLSVADGYVSRVTQGLYGFGNAVYVSHPDGHTSVYCHLRSFSPRIQRALRRYQYRHHSSAGDATFSPLECPVSQGQFIALSGNTGHSTGPHLHLEIHDSRTWDMLDPFEFISDAIADTVPPRLHGLMAIPQQGGGVFQGTASAQTFQYTDGQHLTAWGRVGFALWADDYMQESYNHYGIRLTILKVDGREVFRSDVGRIPVNLNRYVNVWGVYDHWLHHRTWYLKSYQDPGLRLPFIQTDAGRGVVDFSEERPYHLEYILCDFLGNESHYAFTVHGQPGAVPRPHRAERFLFSSARTNSFSLPGEMQLVVPAGFLGTDVLLQPHVKSQPDKLSDAYSFYPQSLPLLFDAEISIRVSPSRLVDSLSMPFVPDPAKFYIRSGAHYQGGTYREGWVKATVRDLSQPCSLAYDDTPPEVSLLSAPSVGNPVITLRVTDTGSGLDTYTATLDGQYLVFDAQEKSARLVCRLSESPLRPTGRQRRLVFSATDHRGNTSNFETNIVY